MIEHHQGFGSAGDMATVDDSHRVGQHTAVLKSFSKST